ncbi:MAG: prepilin-type N-terminal cleavage/methylation domain-containing protein [Candidatus Magasanikbacteria bacterium]|nr:prepilin-type N-terminal cleavage/methylation domain-containing protein [Candidatus Magasanikbacteria bacterium]
MQTQIKNKSGFTLIEMLVTIAIMLLLIGIAIPFEMSYRKKAEIKKSAKELRSLFWEAQNRSLAPRDKDVTAYKISLTKNPAGGATIHLQECKPSNNPSCIDITGGLEPKVELGGNIIISDIQLYNGVSWVTRNSVSTAFFVGDGRSSGQISFDYSGDKMTVILGSLIYPSLKYDIVVDGRMGSITYGVEQ